VPENDIVAASFDKVCAFSTSDTGSRGVTASNLVVTS
jgi:hypothetical protein